MSMKDFSEEVNDFLYTFQDAGYNIENRMNGGGGISIFTNHYPFEKFKDDRYLFSTISEDFFRLIEWMLTIVSKVSFIVNGPISVHNPIHIGFIIHRTEKDWEERLIKDIGLNTKIQSIIIEI